MPKAKIVSFINYKGGVAKTTTTYHVGCSLVQHFNKKVLLVDIDPQTNLTFLCASIEKWTEFKKKIGTIATLYQRYQKDIALDTKRFIWRSPIVFGRRQVANLDLIPCDIDLLGEDLGGGQITGSFPSLEVMRKQARLYLHERTFMKKLLKEVEDDYDYILIDCPPNLYLMTQNALAASRWYLVTAIPDHLSTIGLRILQNKVAKIGELFKSAQIFAGDPKSAITVAQLGGIVFVRVRIGGSMLTNVHSGKMVEVERLEGKGVCFATHTTELIGYSEAAESTAPIWMLTSSNAVRASAKHEYEDITKEFMERF
jgi:chromosome partitioning protein